MVERIAGPAKRRYKISSFIKGLLDDVDAATAAATLAVAKLGGGQNLTGGFTATSGNNGTISSGTFTPDAQTGGNIQHYTNNGAHTLAPPASACSIILDQTNGASAGAVTRSGFTKVTGDSLTTTSGNKFRHFITVGNGGSHCHTQALQ